MCFQLCIKSLCLSLSCFDNAPVHKAKSIKKCFFPIWGARTWLVLTSTPSHTRPDHPTSVLDLTKALVAEWEKIHALRFFKILWKTCCTSRSMPMVLKLIFRSPHTFGHVVCMHTLYLPNSTTIWIKD